MTRASLAVLLLALVVVACDSGSGPDDEANVFSGPYEGQATATFTGGITVDYDIRLDLDEPDINSGQYVGTIRIVRAPVGSVGEVTVTGTVFGFVSGSDFQVSGTTPASGARTSGGGFGFGGQGTLNGSTIQLTTATIFDPAYASSTQFSMTLQ